MVLVVDFGSQYTELLVKKIRGFEVFAEIIDYEKKDLIDKAASYDAIILSGSPDSAIDEAHEKIINSILKLEKPTLCICYGMQVVHKILGGKLEYGTCSEFGETKVRVNTPHDLVDGIPAVFDAWMSHHDSVVEMAPGFVSVARTDNCFSITANDNKKIYTVQFHPEVEHSTYGGRFLENFLFLVCKLKKTWNMENMLTQKISQIRNKVGSNTVFLALSGGLDSSVVAKLLQRAKVKLVLIFVETGMMLPAKTKLVIDYFKSEFGDALRVVDESESFFQKLTGVTDPEQKRHIIGHRFIEIFKGELDKHDGVAFLGQGTLHSDLIESGSRNRAQKIKTHHNVLPELREGFELIEPINDLFKNEVKQLGAQLGLPDFIVNAHPFPGPGYAIRIMGDVTKEKVELLQRVDSIYLKKLMDAGLYWKISQCFSVLLNTKSVGVVGDQRCYGYVVALRAINSGNMMTAKTTNIPFEILTDIANEIVNTIPEVTRVVYDLTSKPPATIEWE